MAQVRQLDKRSGITYVYESVSYWDREKKQPRSRRTLIGRLDPETGEIRPTDGRGKRRGVKECLSAAVSQASAGVAEDTIASKAPASEGRPENAGTPPQAAGSSGAVPSPDGKVPSPVSSSPFRFTGAAELLDRIGDLLGVSEDLKVCFPDRYRQILSIVHYLVSEDGTPLYRFGKWASLHAHPYGESIPPSRMEEIFASVDLEDAEHFFALRGNRRGDDKGLTIITVPFPDHGGAARPYAEGKGPDRSGRLSLALVYSEKSDLPLCCGKIAGSVPDADSIRNLVKRVSPPGDRKNKPLLDPGLLNSDEMTALIKKRVRFLCAVSAVPAFARGFLREVSGRRERPEYYNASLGLYIFTKTIDRDAGEDRPRKGDAGRKDSRLYLHLYYSPAKRADDSRAFERSLEALKAELQSGNRIPEHEKDYRRYFDVKKSSKKEPALSVRQSAVVAARERFGFSILVSSDIPDPVAALRLHRLREAAEKAFGDIRERFCLQKTVSSSETALEGKLFLQFAALIYQSWLYRRLEEKDPFPARAAQDLLDQLDMADMSAALGGPSLSPEALRKREEIMRLMGF